DYAHALLLDNNGWASWVAYLRWQGDLHAKPCDEMLQLLAIRMAWELVIWRYLKAQQTDSFAQLSALWLGDIDKLSLLVEQHE
ncbi:putative inorganic carbon transporter subunit DabA, partial [Psychrobacter sp. HY3-MNA-CIBAN-0198]|uniref:putative inorganic carbon transporter subunit DabA n=1 Tax=Psychrobacter sp. HY3-MNA-CIBAN-0198 TaxID=3140441 RepID=UPI0033336A0E